MQDRIDYILGFSIGVLAGLALVFILGMLFKKKNGPCKYDERQILARGKAYRAAFWTLVGYLIFNGVYYGAAGVLWADMMTVPTIGVFLGIFVYAVICIVSDAYLPIKEKPGFYFVLFGVIEAANVFVIVWNYFNGTKYVTDGMLNYHLLNPVVTIIFGVFIAALAAKLAAAKKAVDEG